MRIGSHEIPCSLIRLGAGRLFFQNRKACTSFGWIDTDTFDADPSIEDSTLNVAAALFYHSLSTEQIMIGLRKKLK